MKKPFLFLRRTSLLAVGLALLSFHANALSTIPVGTSQTYTTIQAAYNSISSVSEPIEIVLQNDYEPASESYPITLDNKSGTSLSNTITIKPASDAKITLGQASTTTVITPITTTAGTTLTVPDASNIQPGDYAYGVGVSAFQTVTKSGNVLTFSAPITAATNTTLFFGPKDTKTIIFNNANYVIIDGVSRTDAAQGLTIQNPNNIAAQTINFTGISTNNTIRNCFIKGASVSGTSAADQKGGLIFFEAQANNGNTIENNDICNVGTYMPVTGITLANTTTSASEYNTIQNNNIYNSYYTGISPNAAPAVIYFGSTSTNAWILDNKIYWSTTPATAAVAAGTKDYSVINGLASTTGAQSRIEGNTIGGTDVSASGTAYLTATGNFNGINVNNNATVIRNTVKNISITAGVGVAAAKNAVCIGVTDVAAGLTMDTAFYKNTVEYITQTITNNWSGNLVGLAVTQSASSKARNINNNTVSNMTITNSNTTQGAVIRGVQLISAASAPLMNFSGNKFNNFSCGASNSAAGMTILCMDLTYNTGMVEKNQIYNLKTTSSSVSAYVAAIRLTGGNNTGTTIQNNSIALGTTSSGNIIYGINQNAATATSNKLNIYHNSIYIGGSVATGAVNTYAFYRTGTLPVFDVRNNIFSNQRTGGTGKHYAISVAAATNLATCDKNIYQYTTGSFGTVGTSTTASYPNLSDWKTASSKDASSIDANPSFVSTVVNTPDLHLLIGSPALGAGENLSIADDCDGQTRTATPAIGAFELSNSIYITPVANATYWTGAVLDFTVNYPNAVTITGTPRIPITLNTGGPAYANYHSGSGSTSITFRYVVGANQADLDGIVLGTTMSLNGGSIVETVGGAAASLSLPTVATSGIKVDDVVNSASERRWLTFTAPADGIYSIGQNIDIKASPVSTTGNQVVALINFQSYTANANRPYIPLTLDGGVVVNAVIVEPAGTINATQYKTFRYTVTSGDVSASSISIGNIELNGSTMNYNSGAMQYGQNVTFASPINVRIDGSYAEITTTKNISDYTLVESNSIKVSNGGHLTINQPTTLAGITLNAGGKLTNASTLTAATIALQSDTLATAAFLDNGTTTITTSASAQQQLTGAGAATPNGRFWYVSSPVEGANSSAIDAAGANKLWSYSEAAHAYTEITDNATTLEIGKGYAARLGATATATFTGTKFNNSDQTFSLTSNDGNTKSGYNLIGNPYPSFLDWDAVTLPASVLPTIWTRACNAGGTMAFDTYNSLLNEGASGSGKTATAFVAPLQAFWVKVITGNATSSITVTNAMRNLQDQTVNANGLRAAEVQKVLRLRIANQNNSDEAVLAFHSGASKELDNYDSPKMSNENPQIPEIYTWAGTQKLAINGMNDITLGEELPLGFNTGTANTFTLQATEIRNIDAETNVILKDKLLKTEQNLNEKPTYTFTSEAVSTSDRFSIVFRAASNVTNIQKNQELAVDLYSNENGQITVNCNSNIQGSITVHNLMGQKMIQLPTSGLKTVVKAAWSKGVYLIKVDVEGKSITKKLILN